MARALVSLMAVSLLLLAACSDDDKPKPDLYVVPDMGVDVPITNPEAGAEAGLDAGVEASVDVGPDAGPQYSGLIIAAEVEGRATPGPPPPDAGPPTKLLSLSVAFSTPDPTGKIKPDFIDSPAPPNCTGYKWSAGGAPNATTGDVGKVSFTGHATVPWVNADNLTQQGMLPATIECNRAQLGTSGLYRYDCGLPITTVLPAGSWITDTTKISVTGAGGADIPAFSEANMAAAPIVKAKASFDMNQIDPSAITAEWETTTAALVAIKISASLKDGSEFAEITCSQLGVAGNKTIPAAALALLPTPTATNPLIIRTSLVGFTPVKGQGSWGSYLAAVGRGTFGVSCRLPSGQCP